MMSSIAKKISEIKNQIPTEVTLVAVSKTKPDELVQEAIDAGHFIFGENKAQALQDRLTVFKDKNIQWHFIGHLQTNKVKYIIESVSLIHSVDSFKLLKEINKRAESVNRKVNCLLQFHIATEDTKFGFDLEEATFMLNSDEFKALENITISGVMGMATFTNNQNQVRGEFKSLKQVFDTLKQNYFENNNAFKEISMGMSGDYLIAIEEGSTIIRVGSQIFGERN